MIDLDQLLAEPAESPPCGPDLEYDAAFLELEQASKGKPEQQYGETVVPAEEPAWGEVRKLALELMGRTKDLRVASLLVQSLVCTEGFAGLKPGLDLIHGLIERYWDHLHPNLDPDDDNDPMVRMNALAVLADDEGLLRHVLNSPLIRSRQLGVLLVRDIEVALDKLPPREGAAAISLGQITSMMATEDGVAAAANIAETMESVKRLASLLNERVGAAVAPNFAGLVAILKSLLQVCGGSASDSAGGEASEAGPADAEAGARGAGQAPSGDIRNRRDAMVMIDKIVDYFARHEPSNPAPLLLLRAKRVMDMSFVDIIRDMAPDGMGQVQNIAGIRAEDEY